MILVFIFASCIQLVLENPLTDPDGQLMEILFYIDIGFTCLFGIEAVLKIMAFGFLLNGKQSYLRNYWNILDFIIIFFSIISISFPSLNLEVLKVLRLLRVLRPLRFISKNEGLQVAIRALFKGIPDIFNVIIIACLFLLIFSIIGVNFFKGLYFTCLYTHLEDVTYPASLRLLVSDKWNCLDLGGEWVRYDRNFDDTINSMINSFVHSQAVDWSVVMYQGMASNGEN
mmetsp:Transcript_39313/g.37757  ORF Transcript_39313/g.37757 Transcript_39313/m.37757 type:complete len:228 (+) Transcript_39313:568-1251(+)